MINRTQCVLDIQVRFDAAIARSLRVFPVIYAQQGERGVRCDVGAELLEEGLEHADPLEAVPGRSMRREPY